MVDEIAHEKDAILGAQLLIPGMNRVKRSVDGLIELVFLQFVVHEPIPIESVSGEAPFHFQDGRVCVEPDDDALGILNGVNLGFRRTNDGRGAKHLVVKLLLLGRCLAEVGGEVVGSVDVGQGVDLRNVPHVLMGLIVELDPYPAGIHGIIEQITPILLCELGEKHRSGEIDVILVRVPISGGHFVEDF